MKKLSLDLDTLSVETFETAAGATERGTVHGHGPTWPYNGCTANEPCLPVSHPDHTVDYTCDDYSCWNTCQQSCGGSCYASCTCPTMVNTCAETCQPTVPC
ncbi:hypothetical protein [Longimicrobium sp.]|uniref:hypothetical protein n=1 Tax=Longimicrobium sp. TaxID=2029185 RepID=UPI002E33AD20|nr:hypothetical protein [Longimicrobium sp.]HEX6040202.1 hypothetical protein [Longimicrobium sp.]